MIRDLRPIFNRGQIGLPSRWFSFWNDEDEIFSTSSSGLGISEDDKNGVMKVTFAKAEQAQPKKIPVTKE